MNCQDCELLLANGETSSVLGESLQEALQEHLRDCADCRALQQDLDANASALEDLRNEDLPRIAIKTPQRRFAYGWVAAFAAAAFVAGLLVPSRTSQPARVVAQAPSGTRSYSGTYPAADNRNQANNNPATAIRAT